MRWKVLSSRSSEYTCCFCCHVRMGTVFLGIFNLLLEMLSVAVIASVTLYPDVVHRDSNVYVSYNGMSKTENVTSLHRNDSKLVFRNSWNCNDRMLGLVLTLGSSLFTLALLYGTITGRPRYLLPFFCLQVFDFCITSLSVIGYFSFEPDVKRWIASQKMLPMKEQLMTLENQWLILLAAFLSILLLWTKAYCISIVWTCYKYLVQSEMAPASPQQIGMVQYEVTEARQDAPDNQMMMMMPPKYEDVIQIPVLVAAPPPYMVAVEESQSRV
jgi:lysosomal-associated transmembrane protein